MLMSCQLHNYRLLGGGGVGGKERVCQNFITQGLRTLLHKIQTQKG